jgi:hypothetical protein
MVLFKCRSFIISEFIFFNTRQFRLIAIHLCKDGSSVLCTFWGGRIKSMERKFFYKYYIYYIKLRL